MLLNGISFKTISGRSCTEAVCTKGFEFPKSLRPGLHELKRPRFGRGARLKQCLVGVGAAHWSAPPRLGRVPPRGLDSRYVSLYSRHVGTVPVGTLSHERFALKRAGPWRTPRLDSRASERRIAHWLEAGQLRGGGSSIARTLARDRSSKRTSLSLFPTATLLSRTTLTRTSCGRGGRYSRTSSEI